MKVFAAVAGCFLLCASASFAQINIQGEDGSTVTIGPGGINVNGRGPGSRANVRLGPGGIQIDSSDGYKRSKVNLGTGLNVQTNKGRTTKTVTTTTRRVGSTTVKSTSVNTATRSFASSGPSAEQQVTMIEMKIYGQSYNGKPLMTRVEKLEIDNLGQKGSGPLKTRISILAKELGVTITGASTTIVNSGHSTVSITSPAPETTTVNIRESITRRGDTSAEAHLSDMVLNDNNQTIKGYCNGNAIVVNGNNCQLQLTGKLSLVTINGNHNRIRSDKIDMVVANGDNNTVTWSHLHAAPAITNNGADNAIHAQ